jgi:hypothetical protein
MCTLDGPSVLIAGGLVLGASRPRLHNVPRHICMGHYLSSSRAKSPQFLFSQKSVQVATAQLGMHEVFIWTGIEVDYAPFKRRPCHGALFHR